MHRLISPFRMHWESISHFSLIVLLVLAGTANITNSFMLKWAFSDGDSGEPIKSLRYLENGKAEKPYIFRSSLIQMIGAVIDSIPQSQQQNIFEKLTRKGGIRNKFFSGLTTEKWTARTGLLYCTAYALTVALTAAYLLACYFIAKSATFGLGIKQENSSADAVVCLMSCSLLTPFVFSRWGHFYDFADFCLIMLTFLAFIKSRHFIFIILIILASINKETVFIFPLMLIPLSKRFKFTTWALICSAGVGFLIRLYLMNQWSENPGSNSYWQFSENIIFWLNPISYIGFGSILAPGVPTPHAGNILVLAPLIYFFRKGLSNLPFDVKIFSLLSVLVAFSLVLVVGYKDEFRAASPAFPALLITLLAAKSTSNPTTTLDKLGRS